MEIAIVVGRHKSTISRKIRRTRDFEAIVRNRLSVSNAIIHLLSPFSEVVLTMTSSNGKEFVDHKIIADKLKAQFYFAHPYASWERVLNENTNGLIRQYFPKNRNFTIITQKQINHAMDRLNNRPRKCLAMKTPNQVFSNINPPVALAS